LARPAAMTARSCPSWLPAAVTRRGGGGGRSRLGRAGGGLARRDLSHGGTCQGAAAAVTYAVAAVTCACLGLGDTPTYLTAAVRMHAASPLPAHARMLTGARPPDYIICCTHPGFVATIILPVLLWDTPRLPQKSYSMARPSTHVVALRLPGG
jgi:hypothetical protein